MDHQINVYASLPLAVASISILAIGTSTEADYKRERKARSNAPIGPDISDMLMVLPYILVPPNELQAMFRAAREKAEAAEQSRVHEKVDAWLH